MGWDVSRLFEFLKFIQNWARQEVVIACVYEVFEIENVGSNLLEFNKYLKRQSTNV